jgi:hypothetical protein
MVEATEKSICHSAIGYLSPIEIGAKSSLTPSIFSGEDQD